MPPEQLERQPSTERQPDHVWPSQLERVDERCEAVGEGGEGKLLGRIR